MSSDVERRIAERLYELAPDVYRLALPTDFTVGDVNAYFLDGPDPALIDTGIAGERNLKCIESTLGHLGRRIEDIRTVLISHSHIDHAGSAQAIRPLSGARVWAHPRGHWRLRDVKGAHQASMPPFRRFMERSGFSADALDKYEKVGGAFLIYTESCPELSSMVQGDSLSVAGGRQIAVHETFGHTSNHLSFLLEDAGLAFTGDHVLPRITSNPTLEMPGPGEEEKARPLILYQESLGRTAQFPVEVACPGHDRPFRDLARRCQQLLAHQRQRCEQVLEILNEAGSMDRKQLSLALFGKVHLWEVFLTLSEVQAAVELLESEGQVRVVPEAEIDRIEPV